MRSIYDIINEAKDQNNVWVVKGPDGAIQAVADTEPNAKEIQSNLNKEAGGDVFTIEESPAKDYLK